MNDNYSKKNKIDRVAIIADNSVEYVKAVIDIWAQGKAVVLIDWRIPIKKIIENLKEADIKECYVDEKLKNQIMNYLDIKIHTFSKIRIEANEVPEDICKKFNSSQSDDDAIIFFSSGTTGKAKGITLSHKAINKNSESIIEYLKVAESDVIYIAKTLAHSSTFVGELLVGLKTNAKIIVSPTVVSTRFTFNNIKKYNATLLAVNPTLLNLYVSSYKKCNVDCTSIRAISCSGAILNKNKYLECKEVFSFAKILNVYGLSEAGPRVTAQRYEDEVFHSGSVGKPIKDVEIKIISSNGDILREGVKGIVHVNTPCRMTGYLMGINTKQSLYKGWINTGDIGYVKSGELYIVGREDDMIIQGSHNVYPQEVEDIIKESPNIRDCVVFGIEDNLLGQKIICLAVLEGKMNETKKFIKILRKDFSKVLASYEIPNEFYFIDNLPQTENGKISRKKAIEYYNQVIKC